MSEFFIPAEYDTPDLEAISFPLDPTLAPAREAVTHIYETTRRLDEAGHSDENVNASIGRLGELERVTLLSEPDFRGEGDFRCAEWTFGFIYREPWALKGFTVDTAPQLWVNPVPFLLEQGFAFVDEPESGDVVAYGDILPTGHVWLEHFGIYRPSDAGADMVVSKFGQGPIVEHPLAVVSTVWGGKYFYLEKETPLVMA